MLTYALLSFALIAVQLQASAAILEVPQPIAGVYEEPGEIKYGASAVQWAIPVVDEGGDALPRPPRHPPPPGPPKTEKTIYQFLNSTPEFSILAKVVNLNNETIELLNTSDITFFAPPNRALKPPRRHSPHEHGEYTNEVHQTALWTDNTGATPTSWADLVAAVESLESNGMSTNDDEDEKKNKWRKIIKAIARAVIAYHVIPKPLAPPELGVNTTYATNLTIGYGFLDGQPSRLRIQPQVFPPGVFSVNIFSQTYGHELVTANGILYKVVRPLLPPPAIFQELFGAASAFSTATSAFQRVGLTAELERIYKHGRKGEHGTLVGAGAATVFVPNERAFRRLPPRLRFFLFSPFGHRVLAKLLRYHIVPGAVLHTDYFHNATASAAAMDAEDWVSVPDLPLIASSCSTQDSFFGTSVRTPTASWEMVPLTPDPTPSWSGNIDERAQPVKEVAKAARPALSRKSCQAIRRPPISVPVYERNFTLPTLLDNYSLNVTVTKQRIPALPGPPAIFVSWISVDGQRVALEDVTSATGAVHVIEHVLNPLKGRAPPHKDDNGSEGYLQEDDSWQGWEDWLVRWADEE